MSSSLPVRSLPRFCAVGLLLAAGAAATAQMATAGGGSSPGASSASSTSAGSSGTGGVGPTALVPQAQQQLYSAGQQGAGGSSATNPYQGSLIEGKATATTLDLSLDDAVARGLRNNLGAILQRQSAQTANGQRLEQLQTLLPTITGDASISVQQVNLAAYGLKFPGINPIIGPFQVVDFRANLQQTLFNVQSLETYLQSKHNFQGAKLSAEDARDMVVLTVGNAYLVCIADGARIVAVQAELQTSKVSLDQAIAAHEAGTSPRLDVLRAQVDYQNEQQTLISTQNQLAKDKIALARVIGLPLDQEFALTTVAPYKAYDGPDAEAAFTRALQQRKDLAADAEQVKAAEAGKKAAIAYQFPTFDVNGNFGDLGTTPGHSHGTYTATGEVSAPILQIARVRGQNAVANAQLVTTQAQYSDQIQQVNADVRDSLLDIAAAAKLVEAARSNLELATEALSEAQQRFRAGVSDNLPVSQAQSQTEQANDQYISALYQHNVAKLSLARALGAADTNYKTFLGGK